jgi:hypothetical membrane protein
MSQPTKQTRGLLACGVVAGPLFVAVSLIQAFARDGFELGRHPISLLSLGDRGWVQIANFIVSGTLCLACAVGIRRVLNPGRGGTWGPLLVGGAGAGLIASGIFVTDAGAGFPPGATAGAPEFSWHGILHEFGFLLAFLGLFAACLVFARRMAASGARHLAVALAMSPLAALAITMWPHPGSLSVRVLIGSAVLLGLLAVVAERVSRGLPEMGRETRSHEALTTGA